jgi:hypothetical protein
MSPGRKLSVEIASNPSEKAVMERAENPDSREDREIDSAKAIEYLDFNRLRFVRKDYPDRSALGGASISSEKRDVNPAELVEQQVSPQLKKFLNENAELRQYYSASFQGKMVDIPAPIEAGLAAAFPKYRFSIAVMYVLTDPPPSPTNLIVISDRVSGRPVAFVWEIFWGMPSASFEDLLNGEPIRSRADGAEKLRAFANLFAFTGSMKANSQRMTSGFDEAVILTGGGDPFRTIRLQRRSDSRFGKFRIYQRAGKQIYPEKMDFSSGGAVGKGSFEIKENEPVPSETNANPAMGSANGNYAGDEPPNGDVPKSLIRKTNMSARTGVLDPEVEFNVSLSTTQIASTQRPTLILRFVNRSPKSVFIANWNQSPSYYFQKDGKIDISFLPFSQRLPSDGKGWTFGGPAAFYPFFAELKSNGIYEKRVQLPPKATQDWDLKEGRWNVSVQHLFVSNITEYKNLYGGALGDKLKRDGHTVTASTTLNVGVAGTGSETSSQLPSPPTSRTNPEIKDTNSSNSKEGVKPIVMQQPSVQKPPVVAGRHPRGEEETSQKLDLSIERIGSVEIEGKIEERVWIRLTNKTSSGIYLEASGEEEQLGDLFLYYDILGSARKVDESIACHFCSVTTLESGENILFSVPAQKIRGKFGLRLSYNFDWEDITGVDDKVVPRYVTLHLSRYKAR